MFAQVLANGLLLGGIYAAIGVGFSLTFGVLNVVNIAHGAMVMLGAYVTFYLFSALHVDPFLSIPASMGLLYALGYAVQRGMINRVIPHGVFMTLVLTFGVSLFLIDVAFLAFSADYRTVRPAYAGAGVALGPVIVPYQRLGAFALSLVLVYALHVLLQCTRTGQAIRATALNRGAAQLCGVDVDETYARTFAIGAALAGAAGSLLSTTITISPVLGNVFIGKVFAIATLGGLGTVQGALVGGLLLGIAESVGAALIGPSFQQAIGFAILVGVLIVRPQGLLGRQFFGEPGASAPGPTLAAALADPSPAAGSRPGLLPRLAFAALVVVAGALISVPWVASGYWVRVLTTVLMYVALAQSLNVIAGYAGYADFGNVLFFGIGAYATAFLMYRGAPFPVAILTGGVLAALTAALFGLPILRLRGPYFAIATIGLMEGTREVVTNIDSLGGGSGMNVPIVSMSPEEFSTLIYLAMFTLAAGYTVAVYRISRSRLGFGLRTIKADEQAAAVIGINTARFKVVAWTLSATGAGLVGGVHAVWAGFISPGDTFNVLTSAEYFMFMLLGGPGTVLGPVLGAATLKLLNTVLWAQFLHGHEAVLGLAIVLIVLLAPNGLMPALRGWMRLRVPRLAAQSTGS